MKNRFWIALPLAATLIIPAAAQTSPSSSNQDNQAPAAQSQPAQDQQTPDQKAADQSTQGRQPLT